MSPDALAGLGLLLVNALLACAAWRLAGRLFPFDPPLARLLHALVAAWACIVLAAFLLGLIGVLGGWTLLAAVALAAGALLLALRKRPRPAAAPRSEWAWTTAWGLLLAFWVGHAVTGGLLRFPADWDSLTYHIPLIDQWLQAGSLYAPDCFHWSNPGNNELVGLWLVGPFSGDFLIGLMNLPAAVLLACAAVELGRRLGLARGLAHLAALAVVCNFVVLNQLTDAGNDVAAAGLFLAALAYALRNARRPRPADLGFCAVAVGLLAGVKFYALGYAGLAGAVAVLGAGQARGWRGAGRAAAAVALGAAVWGGYWYLRNWVVAGSPLYPRGLTADTDLLGRLYPDVARTSFLGNGRAELPGLAVEAVWRMTGPCHLAALLAVPLSAAVLAVTGWRRAGGVARLAFALALVGAAALWLVTPFAVEDEPGTLNQMHWHYCPVRYGLCFLSVAVLGLAALIQDVSGTLRRLLESAFRRKAKPRVRDVLAGAASPQTVLKPPDHRARCRLPVLAVGLAYVPHVLLATCTGAQLVLVDRRLPLDVTTSLLLAANGVLDAAVLGLLLGLWPGRKRALLLAGGAASLVGFAVGCQALAARWHAGFARHYERLLVAGNVFTLLAGPEAAQGPVCVLDCIGSARTGTWPSRA